MILAMVLIKCRYDTEGMDESEKEQNNQFMKALTNSVIIIVNK